MKERMMIIMRGGCWGGKNRSSKVKIRRQGRMEGDIHHRQASMDDDGVELKLKRIGRFK